MRVKASTIMLILLFIGFLSLAFHMENKAFEKCVEVLTHTECVGVFG